MGIRTQRLLSIGSLILVLAFVLGSCAPAATPTPTPAPRPSPTAAVRPGPSPTSAPQPAGQPPTPTAVRPAASPTSAVTATTTVEQPRYGGTLVLGGVADPGSLDTMAEATINAGDPARFVYNSLVSSDVYQDSRPTIPVLAERWTVSEDGLTYTFYLRKNVKFHDGKPMTAADIVFTTKRYAKPPEGVRSTRTATLQNITSIEAVDDYTVKAIVKTRSATALTDIGGTLVYSKAWLEAGGNPLADVNGTSAFMLKTRTANVSYEYVKNPNYWKSGRPYLDGITLYIIGDAGTRVAAIRTGRIMYSQNYFTSFSPTDKESVLKSVPNLNTWTNPVMVIPMFVPNVNRKPWDDLKVRQAMNLGLDRYEWLKVVGQGAGAVCGYMTPGRTPGGVPCEELAKRPGWRPDKTADRAEAKRLLAEAGFPKGIQTTLMVRSIPAFRENAVFLADQLAQIGVQANLDV